MLLFQLIHLGFGLMVSIICALPFGLVNLNVLDAAYRQGNRVALNISFGAAIVEVLFGLIAILAGSMIHQYILENVFINYLAIVVLIFAGLVFLLKKKEVVTRQKANSTGFFKGALLNLVSIQVLLFWLIAVTFLSSKQILQYDFITILVFVLGIWLGKMTVLWFYILLSNKIISKSRILSNNIDIIIGIILLIIAVIQVVKM